MDWNGSRGGSCCSPANRGNHNTPHLEGLQERNNIIQLYCSVSDIFARTQIAICFNVGSLPCRAHRSSTSSPIRLIWCRLCMRLMRDRRIFWRHLHPALTDVCRLISAGVCAPHAPTILRVSRYVFAGVALSSQHGPRFRRSGNRSSMRSTKVPAFNAFATLKPSTQDSLIHFSNCSETCSGVPTAVALDPPTVMCLAIVNSSTSKRQPRK